MTGILNLPFLSSDLDGTLLGNRSDCLKFRQAWITAAETSKALLCYNTGRTIEDTIKVYKEYHLPEPDYVIGGVGTEIFDFRAKKVLKEFFEILEDGWDIEQVEEIIPKLDQNIIRQPEHLQNDYKSSWFYDNASQGQISTIDFELEAAGLDVNVVYSGGRFLDILPKYANKGNALSWLLRRIQIKPEEMVVAGDSGNDISMYQLKGVKGIIVANAQPELYRAVRHLSVYHAEAENVNGVLEGLAHYSLVRKEYSNSPYTTMEKETSVVQSPIEVTADKRLIDQDKLELISEGYQKAIDAIRRNITPLGFSACSLADNQPKGVDENYHSVWARDGAITIIGCISLAEDAEIHDCMIRTFETLIANIAPNGQVPTNVRIRENRPEYSGVGGVASIDSGLWLIISFYEYIKASHQFDFLRRHIEALSTCMRWLGAIDSNNDGLLEIPEAGDWTDLLGNRYNVLYDEVLWYRTNVCFGRMLEWMGDGERAGYYLRLAQFIKKEIVRNFWPSTQQESGRSFGFDDQQFSLGDTQFLISQITPFDFSWRCDVFGNVLAFLYNVLDEEKAQLSYQFMERVGINQPYPVVNLYPPVNVGELDWRRYYTVNLLNLPNHYHNGGIWPYIGGHWVRFLYKLGKKTSALQELTRLAELNKRGVRYAWEFNEWAHGKTGNPMGKVFQAWSASEYIKACQALRVFD